MKFKKIIINNFQSHHNTQIEFADNLNVIIGESDNGKTSIIRALELVLHNKYATRANIKRGFDKLKIELTLNNNDKITRVLSENENYYFLNQEKFNHIQFTPEKILNTHQIFKTCLDTYNNLSLNFSKQTSPYFILNQGAVTKSRAIGRLISLNTLDLSVKKANSKYKKTNQKNQHLKEELDNKKKKLKESKRELKRLKKKKKILLKLKKDNVSNKEKVLTALNKGNLKKAHNLLS